MTEAEGALLIVMLLVIAGGVWALHRNRVGVGGLSSGANWRGVRRGTRERWFLVPDLEDRPAETLDYLTYHETCSLLWWDADHVMQTIAAGDSLEVPTLPPRVVRQIAHNLLTNADEYDIKGMSRGMRHKFTEVLADLFVQQIRHHAERTSDYLLAWRMHFMHPRLGDMYPESDRHAKAPEAGIIAVLTRKFSNWQDEVSGVPMWQLLVKTEIARVQNSFDETQRRRQQALRN